MKCGKSRVFVQSVVVMAVMLLLITGCSKKTPSKLLPQVAHASIPRSGR